MLCKTENTRFTENNNSSNRNRANHFQVYQKSGIQGSTGQSDDILKISDRTDPIAIYVKNLRNRTKGEFVEIQELSFFAKFLESKPIHQWIPWIKARIRTRQFRKFWTKSTKISNLGANQGPNISRNLRPTDQPGLVYNFWS